MDNSTSNTDRPVCYRHQSTPAAARCVSCGRYICQDCATRIQNRNFCDICARALAPFQYQAPAAPKKKRWQDPLRLKTPLVFPGATWGIGEAAIIFIVATIAAAAASAVLVLLLDDLATIEMLILVLFITSIVLYIFLVGGTLFSVLVRHKASLSTIGLKTKGAGRGLALGIGLGFPLYVAGILLGYISQLLIKSPETDVMTRSITGISEGGVSPAFTVMLIVALVVLAPVCEEIFFRGYLYPALRNRMGMQAAMIWNGALFALVHFEMTGFLSRTVLGYGLSYIFEKNRTLAGPMISHAIYNGVMVLAFLLLI